MVPAALPLLTARERDDARRLVQSQGLSFEDGCDDTVGIYDGGRLVATASRAGYVLKMFAIDEAWQGGEALGQLVTALVDLARRAGHDSLFVYTRPSQAASFEACNFRLLVTCSAVTLLELGGGLEAYLAGHRHRRTTVPVVGAASEDACPTPAGTRRTTVPVVGATTVPVAGAASEDACPTPAGTRRTTVPVAGGAEGAKAGAVVVNGNPFTLGHQYLVERAAASVTRLYLFIVREDRSVFPFDVRYKLARDAVAHLQNVVLLDTSRYAVSAGTFPSYFLRRHDEVARSQMEVDARLFGAHIAPAFGIARRFVGSEPYCETTASYNRVLAQALPEYGVALEEIPRVRESGRAVSATDVRAALAAGDLERVARLVPKTTLAFLRSRAGAVVTRRLGTAR